MPPDNLLPALGDLVQRLVPADTLEAPLALAPDTPERMEQPVGRLGVLKVPVELDAQSPTGVGVIAVARELDCPPVLHGHDPAASIWAVHGTCATDLLASRSLR